MRDSVRRSIRETARALAALSRGAALVILLCWTIGRVVSDRTLPTQFLSWIPTVAVVCAVAVLLAATWLLLVIARGSQARPDVLRKKKYPRLRLVAAVWWLGVSVYGMAWEHRFFATPPPTKPGPTDLRIVFWNLGGRPGPGWLESAHAMGGDVLIVAEGGGWNAVHEFSLWNHYDQVSNLNASLFNISTKSAVLEYASMPLGVEEGEGLDPRAEGGIRKRHDPGHAMYFLLDVAGTPLESLARPLVVWVIDLPSDLSIPRKRITPEAAAAIGAWQGRPFVLRPDHRYGAGEVRSGGFPRPDVIVGDFNIPAGSASLDSIRDGLLDAYTQAGAGYCATFPRGYPLWRLDQFFVGRGVHAVGYQTRDMGSGTHLLQVADIGAGP